MYNNSECEWQSILRLYLLDLPQNSILHAHVKPLNLPLEKLCRAKGSETDSGTESEAESKISFSLLFLPFYRLAVFQFWFQGVFIISEISSSFVCK